MISSKFRVAMNVKTNHGAQQTPGQKQTASALLVFLPRKSARFIDRAPRYRLQGAANILLALAKLETGETPIRVERAAIGTASKLALLKGSAAHAASRRLSDHSCNTHHSANSMNELFWVLF